MLLAAAAGLAAIAVPASPAAAQRWGGSGVAVHHGSPRFAGGDPSIARDFCRDGRSPNRSRDRRRGGSAGCGFVGGA
jgi:hypothetical protein